jgi:hypothetical protein
MAAGSRITRLRGDHTKAGHLVKYDPASLWATVDWWRESGPGPKVVHLYELEKIGNLILR